MRVKYGRELSGTSTQESLLWQGPEAIVMDQGVISKSYYTQNIYTHVNLVTDSGGLVNPKQFRYGHSVGINEILFVAVFIYSKLTHKRLSLSSVYLLNTSFSRNLIYMLDEYLQYNKFQ
jgi:hypothetical protein